MKIIPFILLCALPSFAQQTNCLIPGTVSWWRAEGDASDAVGGNSGAWANGEAYAAGKVGQAFNFNGTNSLVEVPDSPSLRFTNAMTVETWIYPRSWGGHYREILSKWDGGGIDQRSYALVVGLAGRFETAVNSDGTSSALTSVSSTNTIPINTWTHVAGVYDGASLTVYVNGRAEATAPHPLGIFPSTAPLIIGAALTAGSFFDGLIDEPTLYNRALSSAEVQAIYDAGSTGKNGPPLITGQPQNQVGYWGQGATFSVRAIGGDSLSYQWSKGGTEIDGATDSSLVLTNLQAGDAAGYSVTVTNSCGSTTSSNAFLTVNPAGVSLALYAGITISGVAGFTYGIQFSTDLSNTNGWQGIANVTLNSPSGFWLDVQPATQPQRYYRVVPGPISVP